MKPQNNITSQLALKSKRGSLDYTYHHNGPQATNSSKTDKDKNDWTTNNLTNNKTTVITVTKDR